MTKPRFQGGLPGAEATPPGPMIGMAKPRFPGMVGAPPGPTVSEPMEPAPVGEFQVHPDVARIFGALGVAPQGAPQLMAQAPILQDAIKGPVGMTKPRIGGQTPPIAAVPTPAVKPMAGPKLDAATALKLAKKTKPGSLVSTDGGGYQSPGIIRDSPILRKMAMEMQRSDKPER